jgi:hypothetical protein
MKRYSKHLILIGIAITILGTALGLLASPAGQAAQNGEATPAVTSTPVVVTNTPLPIRGSVSVQKTLVNDGRFFSVTKPSDPDPTLIVPKGVVLTDAHVTFSVGENFANSASLFINDSATGKTYFYEIVNNTTFHAGVDLGSGILSTGQLAVTLSCYNIASNHCQGALMWSGYKP